MADVFDWYISGIFSVDRIVGLRPFNRVQGIADHDYHGLRSW